jgi:hypothetical protein
VPAEAFSIEEGEAASRERVADRIVSHGVVYES